MNNNSIFNTDCQSLDDELENKFVPKKKASEPLVLSYYRLGYEKKARAVSDCGTVLDWACVTPLSSSGGGREGFPSGEQRARSWKLQKANFCKDRLCPMCAWRRSYKIFGQVSRIMDKIADDYDFLFLTLTVPNCYADELIQTIDNMQKGFYNYIRKKNIKNVVKGYFKALEITYNRKSDMFHPHFHLVLAVDKQYCKSRDYISRDLWLRYWQEAMKDFSITQVDIRKAKAKKPKEGQSAAAALSSAVAEIAKYAVKSSDYLFENNDILTDKLVGVFVSALHHRRLTAFGGCFDEAHKALKLDDAEDGDLVHFDTESLRPDLATQIYRYGWSCGMYKLMEVIDYEIKK